MSKIIRYYTPISQKIRAGSIIATIDWFKKHFKMPLDYSKFEESVFEEEGDCYTIPQLKWIVNIDIKNPEIPRVNLQGVVEKIIIDKQVENEYIYILLNPI